VDGEYGSAIRARLACTEKQISGTGSTRPPSHTRRNSITSTV
jgi:hypothetical protein